MTDDELGVTHAARLRGGKFFLNVKDERGRHKREQELPSHYTLSVPLKQWMKYADDGSEITLIIKQTGGRHSVEAEDLPLRKQHGPDPSHGDFRNPYTFIPTPDSAELPPGLQYGPARSMAAYDLDSEWAGTLRIRWTALTPLLLPDTAAVERAAGAEAPAQRSKKYPVRLGPDGRPLLHGAALKGAIRSAFEAITASRYGVFTGHDLPPAYRVPASGGLELAPARVVKRDSGTCFHLCTGDERWRNPGHGATNVNPAVWVPAYQRHAVHFSAGVGDLADLDGNSLRDAHGRRVAARVRCYRHQRGFAIWRATHIASTREILGSSIPADHVDEPQAGNLTLLPGVEERTVEGWLSITGHSIATKHNERLFVDEASLGTQKVSAVELPVTPENLTFWSAVLAAYQEVSDPERVPPGLVQSWHVRSDQKVLADLPEGSLVYVRLGVEKEEQIVTEVHPVMIGRKPFAKAPADRLSEQLRPAEEAGKLSCADRVFGWVPQTRQKEGRSVGLKGRIRIGQAVCLDDDWLVDHGDEGLRLAPLSSPKPTQFRFYGSGDRLGSPYRRGVEKGEGYTSGLRGRKSYWWPRRPDDYWDPAAGPRDSQGRPKEYLAHDDVKDSQVTRHEGWVRAGTRFETIVRVDGLTAVELGALIWLLTRSDGAALRLGGGKPLGLGAVRVELIEEPAVGLERVAGDSTAVFAPGALAEGWRSLQRPQAVPYERLIALAAEFEELGDSYLALKLAREAFLATARGVDAAVHYPRTDRAPEAETYRWFVANEREAGRQTARGHALPHVLDEPGGLPYLT